MIGFKCGVCGEDMEAPQDMAGQVVNCPKCGASRRVPPQMREEVGPLTLAEATIPNRNEKGSGLDALAPAMRHLQPQIPTHPAASPAPQSRECPFCRQAVDSRASRCPHCSAEIGRLQVCIQCPICRDMVCPIKVVATDESGFLTKFARVEMAGAFLPATEETYTGCPICKTPIDYCPRCGKVTVSKLSRRWVGVGFSKSGYQYSAHCSACGAYPELKSIIDAFVRGVVRVYRSRLRGTGK